MYKILICDDDRDIVNALKIYLSDPDYQLFEAFSGLEALELTEKEEFQLVLMDIMMPGMDGISAMVKLREKSNVPVILLTAKSEDSDKILGLTVGADDYITKPFNPAEVTARVRSQLRRYTQLGGNVPQKSKTFVIGGLELDDSEKRVLVDGEEAALTPKEYELLFYLIKNKNVCDAIDICKKYGILKSDAKWEDLRISVIDRLFSLGCFLREYNIAE